MWKDGLDSLVTGAVNKCWKTEIDTPMLVAVLRGEGDITARQPHVGLFFPELSIDAAVSFILKHNLRGAGLQRSYHPDSVWNQ